MGQTPKDFEALVDDGARPLAFDVGDEANATCVALLVYHRGKLTRCVVQRYLKSAQAVAM